MAYQPYKSEMLGYLAAANMNSTADQAIPISLNGATGFVIDSIVVYGASTSLTTCAGGVYPTTAKGGTAIVAAAQVYTALTAASKRLELTLAAQTDYLAVTNIYLSLTTGQGGAATAKVAVYGRRLP